MQIPIGELGAIRGKNTAGDFGKLFEAAIGMAQAGQFHAREEQIGQNGRAARSSRDFDARSAGWRRRNHANNAEAGVGGGAGSPANQGAVLLGEGGGADERQKQGRGDEFEAHG